MKEQRNKSVTLLELLIAIVLLAILVLGLTSIDVFSRYHVISSDRRSKLQNEAYLILEHMTKNMSLAIGNEVLNGAYTLLDQTVNIVNMESEIIKVYVDASADGIRQAPVVNPTAVQDHWEAYRYYDINSAAGVRNQVQYCDRCSDDTCATCMTSWATLGTHIVNFSPSVGRYPVTGGPADNCLVENYVQIGIVGCWDPMGCGGAPGSCCGQTDHPQVNMLTRIKMPAVSTY